MRQTSSNTRINLIIGLQNVFLDFNVWQKAYKLYDIQSKKVIVSRDFIFHENIFLYFISESPPLTLVSSIDDFLEPDVFPSYTHDISNASSPTLHESVSLITIDSYPAPLTQSLWKSTRTRYKPAWLSDFVSSAIQSLSAAMDHNLFSIASAGRPYPINTYVTILMHVSVISTLVF